MIAPGRGSGAPGTGQRAESMAVRENAVLLALTAFAGFALAPLVESPASESTWTESVETVSAVSAETTGRGAWIGRGVQGGGPGSVTRANGSRANDSDDVLIN